MQNAKKKKRFLQKNKIFSSQFVKEIIANTKRLSNDFCGRANLRKAENQTYSLELYIKETLAQVFSCEFFKNFKNICFTEQLWATGIKSNITFLTN